MTTIPRLRHAALAAALLLACSGDDPETTQGSTASASASASSTSGASASSSVSASSTSKGSTTANVSGSGTATDGSGTGATTDGSGTGSTTGGKITGCYPPDNPCPEGQKCTFDGDAAHTQCVPIDPTPKGLGEACQNEGPMLSGLDNCDDGLLCWNVDPETGLGECAAFCVTDGAFFCPLDAATSCSWCQECALGVCVPGCDPLLQDCQQGAACLPSNDSFTCIDGAQDGLLGEPCEFINACAPGLACIDGSYLPECAGAGCCAAFCDLQEPDCQEPTVCVPWYEMDPPEAYADVGICILPQP